VSKFIRLQLSVYKILFWTAVSFLYARIILAKNKTSFLTALVKSLRKVKTPK